jgi:methylmalonyl-CoA mutase cobalamin-binding domain/chain
MKDQEKSILEVRDAVVAGDVEVLRRRVDGALREGISPEVILDDGLSKGADIVGKLFEEGKVFLPELMRTGIALKAGMQIVVPHLQAGGSPTARGIVVMATIKSDVHDIGKNLVSSMLSAAGFVVHDLGVDVPIGRILDEAEENGADIIGASALLTTSASYLRELVATVEARGLRDRYKIMVGGAAVTQAFSESIRADGTASSAVAAVGLAKALMEQRMPTRGELK